VAVNFGGIARFLSKSLSCHAGLDGEGDNGGKGVFDNDGTLEASKALGFVALLVAGLVLNVEGDDVATLFGVSDLVLEEARAVDGGGGGGGFSLGANESFHVADLGVFGDGSDLLDVGSFLGAGHGGHADGSATGGGASGVGYDLEGERLKSHGGAGEVAVDKLADELAVGLGGDVVGTVLEEGLGGLLHGCAAVVSVESALISDGVAVGPDVLGDVTIESVGGNGTSVNVRESSLEVVNNGAVKGHGRASGVLNDNGTLERVSLVAGKVLAVVLDVVGAGDAHVDNVAGDFNGVKSSPSTQSEQRAPASVYSMSRLASRVSDSLPWKESSGRPQSSTTMVRVIFFSLAQPSEQE